MTPHAWSAFFDDQLNRVDEPAFAGSRTDEVRFAQALLAAAHRPGGLLAGTLAFRTAPARVGRALELVEAGLAANRSLDSDDVGTVFRLGQEEFSVLLGSRSFQSWVERLAREAEPPVSTQVATRVAAALCTVVPTVMALRDAEREGVCFALLERMTQPPAGADPGGVEVYMRVLLARSQRHPSSEVCADFARLLATHTDTLAPVALSEAIDTLARRVLHAVDRGHPDLANRAFVNGWGAFFLDVSVRRPTWATLAALSALQWWRGEVAVEGVLASVQCLLQAAALDPRRLAARERLAIWTDPERTVGLGWTDQDRALAFDAVEALQAGDALNDLVSRRNATVAAELARCLDLDAAALEPLVGHWIDAQAFATGDTVEIRAALDAVDIRLGAWLASGVGPLDLIEESWEPLSRSAPPADPDLDTRPPPLLRLRWMTDLGSARLPFAKFALVASLIVGAYAGALRLQRGRQVAQADAVYSEFVTAADRGDAELLQVARRFRDGALPDDSRVAQVNEVACTYLRRAMEPATGDGAVDLMTAFGSPNHCDGGTGLVAVAHERLLTAALSVADGARQQTVERWMSQCDEAGWQCSEGEQR